METIKDILKESIEREGVNILIDNEEHIVIFRRNDKGNTSAYTTMYAQCGDKIKQGQFFTVNKIKYLIMKEVTAENSVYHKYECIECNASVKWMYGKGDLVIYNGYLIDMNDSINRNQWATTLSSKIQLVFSLNEESKRIISNGRFFCGSFHCAWKVTELNYINNLCYIYAERDIILTEFDDVINGIAERWRYDEKPSNYTIEIEETNIEIEQDETATLIVSVSKDGEVMEEQPIINWSVIEASVCTIDASNVVTGNNIGETKITGSYTATEDDICTTDSVMVKVKEKSVVVGEIEVTPSYTNSYYALTKGTTQEFVCSIENVENPNWNIIVDPNGNTASKYIATIDNVNGKFIIQNINYSSDYLICNITEIVTGKTFEYIVRLIGAF